MALKYERQTNSNEINAEQNYLLPGMLPSRNVNYYNIKEKRVHFTNCEICTETIVFFLKSYFSVTKTIKEGSDRVPVFQS